LRRSLSPPGQTEDVTARTVLVLAPHHDDEVLGCGGLVSRLASAGASVRVLFLTDGGGGVEAPVDAGSRKVAAAAGADERAARRAYALRRAEEARAAAAVLGVEGIEQLGFEDGSLEQHVDELAAAVLAEITAAAPDLVLVPSPLEATPDHRAAFAALHGALHPLRGEPAAALAETSVLAYEINHPGYPDLLVDVSDRLETIARAMACHASQLERHDYLEAALGLRRFRTHSLPPGIRAAEGYCRLALSDFTTRSLSALVSYLGGVYPLLEVSSGPRISVIVRTRDRPELLAEALESLSRCRYRRLEVVLVNDGGTPPRLPEDFPYEVRSLDLAPGRGRAGAANAGLAEARGDLLGFLDDDDLVYPEHYATHVDALRAATVSAVYTDAAVTVHELAGGTSEDGRGPRGWRCVERRLPYSRDFDPDVLLMDNYVPLHTLVFERRLLEGLGGFDESLPVFEDWDFLVRLAERAPFHHLPRVTCEYRHFPAAGHHGLAGRDADREALFLETKARVLHKHADRLTAARLAAAITRVRRETVEAVEAAGRAREETRLVREHAATLQRELVERARELHELWLKLERTDLERDRVQQRLFDVEKDYHRTNGEVATLRAELERLQGDLREGAVRQQRSFDQEAELRRVVDDQTEHLRRTYAEIERLASLIRAMENSRAWRLHRFLERRRSP
jgi:LmbE family N-acetylglucosaminyl deacetylase/glycosyltransferase involved in cell wall biosynthesis